jgi:hypothetical protein
MSRLDGGLPLASVAGGGWGVMLGRDEWPPGEGPPGEDRRLACVYDGFRPPGVVAVVVGLVVVPGVDTAGVRSSSSSGDSKSHLTPCFSQLPHRGWTSSH